MLKKGDSVFYCDNCDDYKNYAPAFLEVCNKLELLPIFYAGIGKSVKSSSLDTEVRSDLFSAKVVVVRICHPDAEDNYALQEKSAVMDRGAKFITYSSISSSTPSSFQDVSVVRNVADFSAQLERHLRQLI